jgi:hypothetical protein
MRYRKLIKRGKYKKKGEHSSTYKKYVKIKKVPVGCGLSPRAALILSFTVPFASLVVFKLMRHFLNQGQRHVRYRWYSPLRFARQG